MKKGEVQRYALYKVDEQRGFLPTPLGVWGYDKRIYREQKIKVVEYSEEQAIEIARERGVKKLRRQMQGDVKISDSHVEVLSSPSDSIVRIKVSVESVEDISRAQPINTGEISNKDPGML